ncbi:MAG TPA: hypothetical protein PKB14_10070 [Rubrivivax sp.]|nr:hypothetical protein [Rubrivivax sp.]
MVGRRNKREPLFPARSQHVPAAFGERRAGASRWRHLRRCVLPVPRVEAAWRD